MPEWEREVKWRNMRRAVSTRSRLRRCWSVKVATGRRDGVREIEAQGEGPDEGRMDQYEETYGEGMDRYERCRAKRNGDERKEWAGKPNRDGRSAQQCIVWPAREMASHEGKLTTNSWLPSANSIPTSSYSLDRLLSTPFGGIDIIPDDRYVS